MGVGWWIDGGTWLVGGEGVKSTGSCADGGWAVAAWERAVFERNVEDVDG